ncbi:MAG: hypothetical protein QOF78_3213 [Phycisphaerales bacterium]|jgi:hypothetical protein|nr:hypothetical protein [Phycisphaerales bacterium]
MEPVTLILTALVAGAAAALKDSASDAVKSAYEALKAKLRPKLAPFPGSDAALDHLAEEPDAYRPLLESAVRKSGAADDADIREAAELLLAKAGADSRGAISNVTVNDSRGTIVGHGAKLEYNEGSNAGN